MGDRPPPLRPMPEVVARVGVDLDPIDVTDPDDARWLRACVWRLPLDRRVRLLHRLDEAATDRPVAWVSVEGVGVAPSIPTFGDRRASGHSIIGLATFDRSTFHAEAVGRRWSRGRVMAWLADPEAP